MSVGWGDERAASEERTEKDQKENEKKGKGGTARERNKSSD